MSVFRFSESLLFCSHNILIRILLLISVENDTLKVITFVIPSITFSQKPSNYFQNNHLNVPNNTDNSCKSVCFCNTGVSLS